MKIFNQPTPIQLIIVKKIDGVVGGRGRGNWGGKEEIGAGKMRLKGKQDGEAGSDEILNLSYY